MNIFCNNFVYARYRVFHFFFIIYSLLLFIITISASFRPHIRLFNYDLLFQIFLIFFDFLFYQPFQYFFILALCCCPCSWVKILPRQLFMKTDEVRYSVYKNLISRSSTDIFVSVRAARMYTLLLNYVEINLVSRFSYNIFICLNRLSRLLRIGSESFRIFFG